jgi:hypothetical protein
MNLYWINVGTKKWFPLQRVRNKFHQFTSEEKHKYEIKWLVPSFIQPYEANVLNHAVYSKYEFVNCGLKYCEFSQLWMCVLCCLSYQKCHYLKECNSQNATCLEIDGIFYNWNYMFRPILAVFRLLQIWGIIYKSCNIKRLYENPVSITIEWIYTSILSHVFMTRITVRLPLPYHFCLVKLTKRTTKLCHHSWFPPGSNLLRHRTLM